MLLLIFCNCFDMFECATLQMTSFSIESGKLQSIYSMVLPSTTLHFTTFCNSKNSIRLYQAMIYLKTAVRDVDFP